MNIEKLKTIGIIKNATTELHSYLRIANSYVYTHCQSEEILHIGLLLDKMYDHVENLNKLFLEDKLDMLLK